MYKNKYTIYKTNKRIRSDCHIEHNLAHRPPALQKFETFLHRLAVERQHLSQDRFDQTFIRKAGKDIVIKWRIFACAPTSINTEDQHYSCPSTSNVGFSCVRW